MRAMPHLPGKEEMRILPFLYKVLVLLLPVTTLVDRDACLFALACACSILIRIANLSAPVSVRWLGALHSVLCCCLQQVDRRQGFIEIIILKKANPLFAFPFFEKVVNFSSASAIMRKSELPANVRQVSNESPRAKLAYRPLKKGVKSYEDVLRLRSSSKRVNAGSAERCEPSA